MKIKKMHGAMLVSIVLTMFLIISVSIGFFYLFSASNNSIQAKEKAITAQRYAQEKTEEIKLIPYDEIVSKVSQDTWATMPGDENWEYLIHLGKEKLIDDDENKKQRIADIKIRQKGQKTEEIVLQQVISSSKKQERKIDLSKLKFHPCPSWCHVENDVIKCNNMREQKSVLLKDGFYVFDMSFRWDNGGENNDGHDEYGSFGIENGPCYASDEEFYYIAGNWKREKRKIVPFRKGDIMKPECGIIEGRAVSRGGEGCIGYFTFD